MLLNQDIANRRTPAKRILRTPPRATPPGPRRPPPAAGEKADPAGERVVARRAGQNVIIRPAIDHIVPADAGDNNPVVAVAILALELGECMVTFACRG
ncbi:MAG: hypothetical protein U9N14_04320 [Pseudomonadota bacterium]|nr:hypothetical protein [Pseudomonadota bacterium]